MKISWRRAKLCLIKVEKVKKSKSSVCCFKLALELLISRLFWFLTSFCFCFTISATNNAAQITLRLWLMNELIRFRLIFQILFSWGSIFFCFRNCFFFNEEKVKSLFLSKMAKHVVGEKMKSFLCWMVVGYLLLVSYLSVTFPTVL